MACHSLIYASASASGAFAGLLARGLYAIGATSDVMDAGWRWIFVMYVLLQSGVPVAHVILSTALESTVLFKRLYARLTMHQGYPHCHHRLPHLFLDSQRHQVIQILDA